MHNLFGTDGIRKSIGTTPLTDAGIAQLSKALAQWVITNFGESAHILIAHDTRQSASWIKAALKVALLRFGINTHDTNVLATPAAYALIKAHPELSAAFIISASHNPYQDNGIKIVDRRTHKLTTLDEQHISQLYLQPLPLPSSYDTLGIDHYNPDLIYEYQNYVLRFFSPYFLSGIKVVLDCANGATIATAPSIFRTLGAQVITINNHADGKNINADCGAVHPEHLAQEVLAHSAHIGFAFDGDGDRVIAVNRNGVIKNGDDILALLSEHPLYQHQKTIVGTIMSNYGLQRYLEQKNITLIRTSVGDKHVAEYLLPHGLLLGGEQSGHIILNDYLSTGDGVFTALRILETLIVTNNWDFHTFNKYPQITLSVPITQKKDLNEPILCTIIETFQLQINGGRLLVRYSGTENVLRVMVEDEDLCNAQRVCGELAGLLQKELT
jgi:phosphoglucosamine mutase